MIILTRRLALAALVAGLMAIAERRAVADLIVDVTASSNLTNTSIFGTLNLTTGRFSSIATMTVTVDSLTTGANGTLYAGASDGNLYTVSDSGVATRFGTVSGNNYFGLAYAGASGFYGADVNTDNLDQISPTATSVTTLGALPAIVGTGALSYGPNGSLYSVGVDPLGVEALFVVNTTTGGTTEIGSGLSMPGNVVPTLVAAGGQLYGIDTIQPSGSGPISIFTINTTTGLATATGAAVTGLTAGYTLDTAAAVPEPSSLALCGIAAVVGLAGARGRRGRVARARA